MFLSVMNEKYNKEQNQYLILGNILDDIFLQIISYLSPFNVIYKSYL